MLCKYFKEWVFNEKKFKILFDNVLKYKLFVYRCLKLKNVFNIYLV